MENLPKNSCSFKKVLTLLHLENITTNTYPAVTHTLTHGKHSKVNKKYGRTHRHKQKYTLVKKFYILVVTSGLVVSKTIDNIAGNEKKTQKNNPKKSS